MANFDGELSELLRKSVIILDGSLDELENDSCYGSYEKDLENYNKVTVEEPRNILYDENHEIYENLQVDEEHIGRLRVRRNFENEAWAKQNAYYSWNISDNLLPRNMISESFRNDSKQLPKFELTIGYQSNGCHGELTGSVGNGSRFGFCHEPQSYSSIAYLNGRKLSLDRNIFQVSLSANLSCIEAV